MNRQKAYLVAATLLGVAGLGYGAYAQTGTAGAVPPRLIPFQGYLEDTTAPVNGSRAVTFFITSDPSVDYAASCTNANCMWAETQPAVQFSNGYFSTALGSVTPFSAGVANLFTPGSSDARYVRVRIGGTTLDGAQRLLSSAFAITAETAANFTVTGGLSAGSVTTGGVTSSGNVVISGTSDLRAGGGISVGSSATDAATGSVVTIGDVSVGDGLRVGLHPVSNPAAGNVGIENDLDVDGNVNVAGNIVWANPRYFDSGLITCFKTNGVVQAGCTGPTDIGSTSSRVCFLAGFEVKSADSSNFGSCDVTASGGRWFIDARTESGDIDVRCRARCIQF